MRIIVPLEDTMQLPLKLAGGLRTTFADVGSSPLPERLAALVRRWGADRTESSGAVLIVEDDAELRSLMATLLEDGPRDIIQCESAEATLAIMLIRGREVAVIFADVWLPGVMNGVDLAWEVKIRWPFLPVILISGHPLRLIDELPAGVTYMPKPCQPLSLVVAAEQALASAQH